LTDDKSRFKYDLHLRNPTESEYYHEYQYYKHRYVDDPKIHPAVVIIGVLALVSLLQFVMRKQMYERALLSISESHDFKNKVNERCGNNKKIKEKVREDMLKEVSIEGGYSRPEWTQILIVRLVLLPYSLWK
jgi:DnaJ homolog subfamily C member 25